MSVNRGNGMLLWYSSKFKSLPRWCLYSATFQFITFLFLFLCVSYLSTSLEIRYEDDGTTNVISEYEKYIVLATSLYMVVPFAFSTILIFGLFHKSEIILKTFVVGSIVNSAVILIAMIGSGIALEIIGTAYVAHSLIIIGFILELIIAHGILLIYGMRQKYIDDRHNGIHSSKSMEEEEA